MAVMHSRYHETGTVTIDGHTCKKCGRCAEVCPADVLIRTDDCITVSTESPLGCIACGHCMMVCPQSAITVTGRGISPADLLPRPQKNDLPPADSLEALFRSRRSVRFFTDRVVEPALIEKILDTAAAGPMGIPPWDVGCASVLGRRKIQELAAAVISGYEKFLKTFRPFLGLMRPFMRRSTYDQFKYFILPLADIYVTGHHSGRDMLFYNAPALMIFHHSPYSGQVDATIACTQAMLAAETLGLGTTIIGGAPPIMQRNRQLCSQYGIPPGSTPALAMILGYPAVEFRRAVRRRFTHTTIITPENPRR